jgi:general stress protein CsbA
MKNWLHPSFIIGVVSIILLFVGIGMKANGARSGDIIIFISVGLGAIHWIWSIIDVSNTSSLKGEKKTFWLIAVIAAPILGGMLYYTMHLRRNKIIT